MRAPWKISKRWRDGPAALAIELVIALPILMLVILGCADFGRFASCYIAVTNAAAEGAAWGSMNNTNTYPGGYSAWAQKVADVAMAEAPGLSPAPTCDPAADIVTGVDAAINESYVQVTVHYTFQTVVRFPGLPVTMPMSRTVIMPRTS